MSTTVDSRSPRLMVKGLRKSFPGVKALSGVDLEVDASEVVAVIGENGAGKSTLMKILAGVQPPDQGQILWHGRPISLENTRDAMEQGIVLIHQELNLCDNLNVAENLFLGNYPQKLGCIDYGTLATRLAHRCKKLVWMSRRDCHCPVCRLVSNSEWKLQKHSPLTRKY